MIFNLTTYLERIGLDHCAPTLACLADLQKAQMFAIPFENIQPLLGEVPDLSPEALWRKLVLSGRGGYCFELNALLGMALDAVGFEPRPIMARVRLGAAAGGPRTHLAWAVLVDEYEMLVDAGFGGPGAVGPLAIADGAEQEVSGARFRIVSDHSSGEFVVERKTPEGWFSLYGFDQDEKVFQPDVEAANFLCSRWDKSPFPANLMLNLPGAGGRASLFNTALKIERDGRMEESTIGSLAELAEALPGVFGLSLEEATIEAIWRRLDARASREAA